MREIAWQNAVVAPAEDHLMTQSSGKLAAERDDAYRDVCGVDSRLQWTSKHLIVATPPFGEHGLCLARQALQKRACTLPYHRMVSAEMAEP